MTHKKSPGVITDLLQRRARATFFRSEVIGVDCIGDHKYLEVSFRLWSVTTVTVVGGDKSGHRTCTVTPQTDENIPTREIITYYHAVIRQCSPQDEQF